MQFTFDTLYDRKSLTALAKCIRKTTRKPKSKRSHIIGYIVTALLILQTVGSIANGGMAFKSVMLGTVAIFMIVILIFEDRINGYFASKSLIKGSEKNIVVFDTGNAETFTAESEVGKTEFPYDKIQAIAETDAYFVFLIGDKHGQVYDKNGLVGGSVDEFREFIAQKTGKTIVKVK